MSTPKSTVWIQTTSDYDLFKFDDFNRPIRKNVSALMRSMKRNGFLRGQPIVCVKRGRHLIVKEGQHRLHCAKALKLPVWYVVAPEYENIAPKDLQPSVGPWSPTDFIGSFARQGNQHYQYLLSFMEGEKLSAVISASLLMGKNARSATGQSAAIIRDGRFTVDEEGIKHAHAAAVVINAAKRHVKFSRNSLFVDAVSMAIRVPGCDPNRLAHKIEKHHGLLANQATREAFLELIEKVYNYCASDKLSIKFPALEASKGRNPVQPTE